MYDIFIKNGEVVLPENRKQKLNIGIKNNIISLITTKNDYPCKTVIDAKNLTIIPGVIDSQVHFREPGSVHKEDLETGSKSAALGGVTSIFEMPNTSPPTSTPKLLEEKLRLAKNRMWTNYAFFAGATANNINLIDKLELMEGCAGIKIFMGSSTGNLLVPDDETLTKILNKGFRRIAIHAEDENRLQNRKKLIKKGSNHSFHPIWRDETCAINATKRIIKIVEKIKRPIHILHVSTSEEIELLKKQQKIITVEVTPQHLTLSAPNCYNTLGALAQMNPPIRTINHQEALWKGIKDGVVDVIGSDHAPHTLEEKQNKYLRCPSGGPMVQHTFNVMLSLIESGFSLENIITKMCHNPAICFQIENRGFIREGYFADLVLLNLTNPWKVNKENILYKCGWSPFEGETFNAKITSTFINGHLVYENGCFDESKKGMRLTFDR